MLTGRLHLPWSALAPCDSKRPSVAALLDPLAPRLLSQQLHPSPTPSPTRSFTFPIAGNGPSVFQVPAPIPAAWASLLHVSRPRTPSAGLTFEISGASKHLLPAPLLPLGPAPITSCRDYSFLFSLLLPQQPPEGSCQHQSRTSPLAPHPPMALTLLRGKAKVLMAATRPHRSPPNPHLPSSDSILHSPATPVSRLFLQQPCPLSPQTHLERTLPSQLRASPPHCLQMPPMQ